MLTDLSRDPPRNSKEETNSKLIPDPWTLTSPSPKTHPLPATAETWKFAGEPHPLISPAGCPNALELASAKFNAGQELLQDWLKLKAEDAKKVTVQLQQALGLLYWLEMIA
ncbi:MAG: hypothetical protein AB4038_21265 [Prochloraceae cyanobacterium]